MTSPTKQLTQLQLSKGRTRGDSIDLQGPDIEVMSECPVPEPTTSLYTEERLRQSLVYAL